MYRSLRRRPGHDINSASWQACAGVLTQTFIGQASLARLIPITVASPRTRFPAVLAAGGSPRAPQGDRHERYMPSQSLTGVLALK
jgi:hypothetical protein